MDIYSNNVQQTVPIIGDEEIEKLERVRFQTVKTDSINGYIVNKDLYTANDKEFLNYFERLTKRKKSKILEELELELDWSNNNRIRNRLLIMNTFKKDIKIPIVKEEKSVKIIKKTEKKIKEVSVKDKDFNPLIIKFTVEKDIYTASDEEFMKFLKKVTKSSEKRLLNGVADVLKDGWTNANRMSARLSLVNRFKVSISSALEKGIEI